MADSGDSRAERARLLRRVCAGGDARAARRFVELYSHRLYGLAFRVLSDREAAEDVVQEVFLRLLDGRATYRGRGHPDAFLLKVTSFLAIDRARARVARERKETAAMERSPSSQPPILDGVLRDELEAEIALLLKGLPPETRAALALRFWEGATLRETARMLASTRSSVSRRIEAALEKLRRPLLAKGFGAALVAPALGDVLRGMEVTPPAAGFQSALVTTLSSGLSPGGIGLSTVAARTVAEGGAGTMAAGKIGLIAGAVAVAALVIYSLIAPLSVTVTTPGPVVGVGGVNARQAPGSDPASAAAARDATTEGGGGDRGSRTNTVAGLVLLPDGRPAPGAAVRVYAGEERLPFEYAAVLAMADGPLAETRARRDGSFSFRGLEPGSYRIVATTPSSAPGTSGLLRLARGETPGNVTIRLAAGQVVEGTARLESGDPAAGVRVRAFLPVVMGERRVSFWPYETKSGPDGTLRIPGIGRFAAELLVDSERHAVIEAPKYARRGEELAIVVSEGATVTGAVVAPDGTALAGAEVLAFTPLTNPGHPRRASGPWILVRHTVADASGGFSLEALADDAHVLLARAGGYALSEPLSIDLSGESPPVGDVRLAVRPSGRIEGRFVSRGQSFGPAKGLAIPAPETPGQEGGMPAAFMTSRYTLDPAAERADAVTFDVGEDGAFVADGLEPRAYVLVAYQDRLQLLHLWTSTHVGSQEALPPTYRPGDRNVEVEVTGAPAALLIAGQVVDGEGAPIANASVECSFPLGATDGRTGARSSSTVWTDQRGVFELALPPPGDCDRVDVRARTLDGRVGVLEGIPLEDDRLGSLWIAIAAGPAIAGTLAAGTGEPVEGVVVKLEQDGNEPWPRAEERQTRSDRRGSFSFSAVEAHRAYRLVVQADGWARASVGGVEIGTLDVHVVLTPEAVIRGRVVDLNGEPVDVTSVSLARHDGDRVASDSSPLETDGRGRFALRGLEAGEYSFSLYGSAGEGGRQPVTRRSERIRVGAGETVDGVVLTMTDVVAIEGRVIDAGSGAPVAGATVADWDPISPDFPRDRIRVTTDGDGRFRMTGFQRGNIRIHAIATGYLKLEEEVQVSGEADASAVLKLIPARTLEVSVVDSGGTAVEGAVVFCGFDWPDRTVTDRSGRAGIVVPDTALDDRSRRDAWISVQKDGYKPIRIEWTDGTSAIPRRVDVLLIRGGRITGRIVDHTGEPLEGVSAVAYRDRQGHGNRSDANGGYTISGLEPGEYEVRLRSETRPLPSLSAPATVVAGRDVRLDFAFPDPSTFDFHSVRIVATLEDGRPAPGFRLQVSEGWAGDGRERRSVSPLACFADNHELATGPDGVLEILFEETVVDGVHVYGSHEVDGELYRIKESRCAVVSGDAAVVYERLPRGEVTLRARDASTGEAVSDYRYSFELRGRGRSGSRCRELDGVARRKVAAGEVRVTVEAEGYAPFAQDIVVEDHGELTLEALLVRE